MSLQFLKFVTPALLLAASAVSLQATSFSTIYAFGDSLTDAGNVYTATGGTIPGAPYSNGRFTNGNVWVQDLSASLGLGPVTASLQGGNDYAYGSALSGSIPGHTAAPQDLTGATGQISQFEAAHPTADPNALYAIWIGSNDLAFILGSAATPAAATTDAGAVVANIGSAIGSLASEGAKNFLIVTVPDLGKLPGTIAEGPAAQAAASTLSAGFDTALVSSLPYGSGLNISVLNTYSLLDSLVANPTPYGFTNVTSPCVTGAVEYVGGTACANPSQYLFWDDLHPTTGGHALVGEAALSLVTPEPVSCGLIGLGLLAIFVRRRAAI
jgi:phospholipase/lecithinase/hemolysin